MLTEDEKEKARLIGHGIREAAALTNSALDSAKERRALGIKFALDTSGTFGRYGKEETLKESAEVVLEVAKMYEEYITNG